MAQKVKNLPAMEDTRVLSLGREDPLEKGMANHSSILAWRIPQTEEPGGSDSEESACNVEDRGSTPGVGRSPGEGNGFPLPCSWLENSMDTEAWRAAFHGVTKSRTRLRD